MKHRFSIDDIQFPQYNVSGGYIQPEYMEWERNEILNNTIFLTDYALPKVFEYKHKGVNVNAFIIESPWNTKFPHLFAELNYNLFDRIYTHNKTLLKLPNTKYIPLGGCWISPEYRKIFSKTKLVSYVVSKKVHEAGHKVRHYIKDSLGNAVDGYGEAYNNYVGYKHITLQPYMYQVVVENAREDYFFTEKLLDCFQTGTIPIYWGCPSIGKFFNKRGILSFNTIEGLKMIMNKIGKKDYNRRLEAIKDNFEKSKLYLTAEDYMITQYYGEKIG